jgi:hypothetical protein
MTRGLLQQHLTEHPGKAPVRLLVFLSASLAGLGQLNDAMDAATEALRRAGEETSEEAWVCNANVDAPGDLCRALLQVTECALGLGSAETSVGVVGQVLDRPMLKGKAWEAGLLVRAFDLRAVALTACGEPGDPTRGRESRAVFATTAATARRGRRARARP